MTNQTTIMECYEKLRKDLEGRAIELVMRDPAWKKLMCLLSDKFNTISAKATSESDIATNMDAEILAFSQNLLESTGKRSLELSKELKVSLQSGAIDDNGHIRKKLSGRIDSKYSSFIIEYKKPSAYKTSANCRDAFNQLLEYMNSLYVDQPGSYIGMVTDGMRCQFVVFDKNSKIQYDINKENVSPDTSVRRLDEEMVDKMIKAILNLQNKELNSDNLIKDLVSTTKSGKNVICHLTYSLYNSLSIMDNETSVSYSQWKNNFGLSHDDASKQKSIEDRRRDLAKIIDREKIDTDDEYKILFALHTAIAILAMLIAYRVVLVLKGKNRLSFRDLLDMSFDQRRIELGNIAEGAVSMELNVYNLLELGCYSWAFRATHWTEDINKYVKEIIELLMRYETMPELTNRTDDLFRELYMSIVPVSVRHSLGEYYTPGWLAENVINSALDYLPYDKNHIRVIDTTAGSGTFIQRAIALKRKKYYGIGNSELLKNLLNEVAAIDANTLAVILARINYFLSIADLVDEEDDICIPVFIGDSSVPLKNMISQDNRYYIETVQLGNGDLLKVRMPVNSAKFDKEFIDEMQKIAMLGDCDDTILKKRLEKICENEFELNDILDSWCDLKQRGLITPAVVNSLINSFTLCTIGKFDLVVGNPPWVDWKSLPSVHRENKKEICYERNLFSGDGRTGGNSLNICALISNVSAENWLNKDGVMALLMPQSLLFQQSYEGYRFFKLMDGRRLFFQEIVDWSQSGHPFYPVTQLFCTYILSEDVKDYSKGIPLKLVQLNKGFKLENIQSVIDEHSFSKYYSITEKVVGKASDNRSAFTYANDAKELEEFNMITGQADYIGREGVEYYPQELQLLKVVDIYPQKNTVEVETYQSTKSKIQVAKRKVELETVYLRQLIKGINVSRFHVEPSEYVVAFPYDINHYKVPLDKNTLFDESPKLMKYYESNKAYLMAQTEYSDKIIGDNDAPYYSLARTGKYSHADWYVVFRDNTKWVAAVTGRINTPWGKCSTPAFQNHCVSICERKNGTFITEDEAHYICAILNSTIVEDYILSTSDKRTFKIRIPVKIEEYNPNNMVHRRLSDLSRKAHETYTDEKMINSIRLQIDKLYLQSLGFSEED